MAFWSCRIFAFIPLFYEVRYIPALALGRFYAGLFACLDAAEQPGHIPGEIARGLQALGVLRRVRLT